MKFNKEEHLKVLSEEERGNRKVKIGQFYCILNGKIYPTLGGLRNAVKPNMTIKSYYDEYYKTEGENVCSVCGGRHDNFDGLLNGYSKYCSSKCANRSLEHREAVRNRFKDDPEKLEIALEKQKLTNSRKTSDERRVIEEKRQSTILEKYGENFRSDRTKTQWANRSEEDIKRLVSKANETKRLNGTSEYNYFTQSNKRIVLDGREIFCQGFEDVVLEFLVEFGFNINEIKIGKDVPRIPFNGNICGVYRPDIYIPTLNLLIEVKSNFTFWGRKEFYINNVAKQQASKDFGINHIIFAIVKRPLSDFDKQCFSDFLNMTISSQALNEGKVQRLSGDSEYRPIAIGSGSAKHPKWMVI